MYVGVRGYIIYFNYIIYRIIIRIPYYDASDAHTSFISIFIIIYGYTIIVIIALGVPADKSLVLWVGLRRALLGSYSSRRLQ